MAEPSVPRPMPLEVFLSSTIQDYKKLRREVEDVLIKKAECACHLSEDWTGGFEATVEKCRKKVMQSGGFLLLMGHWYGSVPPGREKSITHLEFEWANERRKAEGFKMAVFRPEPGSRVNNKLRDLARTAIRKARVAGELHRTRLKAFQDQVDDRKDEWRIITEFKSEQDLREHALVVGREWRGYTPLAAAQRQGAAERQADPRLTEAKLGQLGRQPQIQAMGGMLTDMAAYPDSPGAAMIVYGADDAGHRAYLQHVAKVIFRRFAIRRGTFRLDQMSLSQLLAFVAKTLELNDGGIPDSPEALADRIAAALRDQSICLMVERIGNPKLAVPPFLRDFWVPMLSRLKALRAQYRLSHRLIVILAAYAADEAEWAGASLLREDVKTGSDYEKLLRVPCLGDINRADMLAWLDQMEVPDEPAGRLVKLAESLLKNDEDLPDPAPVRVFDRLRDTPNLWPEGDQQ